MNDIAVLIPVHNNINGLIESLSSIDEENVNYDVVVVDDGSEPIVNLSAQLTRRHRVQLLRLEKNQGIEAALNVGLTYIMKQRYRYVARLDAGDLCIENRLKKQRLFLEEHPESMLVGGNVRYLTQDREKLFDFIPPTTHAEIRRAMHFNSAFCHPAVMFRSDVFNIVGMYTDKYPAAEDYALFFKIARRMRVDNLDEFVLYKIDDIDSISNRRRRRQLLSRLQIQWKFFDFFEFASYLGFLQTLLLMVTPGRILRVYKRYRSRQK